MPVNEEKRYEFFTRQIEYKNEKIIQAFELFIKLFIVITGGVLWLKTNKFDNNLLVTFVIPIRAILILLAVGSIITIIVNLRSWWGFRKQLVNQGLDPHAPLPRHIKSYFCELIYIFIIITITFLAFVYVEKILIP